MHGPYNVKCNNTDLIYLKSEGRNRHCSCLIRQRYWFLYSSCGYIQNWKGMCTFQKCNKYSSFYSTQTAVILAKKIILQNIMYECVCKSTFSHVMSTVHSWRQCGPFRIPCAVNGAVAKLKKIHSFFPTSCR